MEKPLVNGDAVSPIYEMKQRMAANVAESQRQANDAIRLLTLNMHELVAKAASLESESEQHHDLERYRNVNRQLNAFIGLCLRIKGSLDGSKSSVRVANLLNNTAADPEPEPKAKAQTEAKAEELTWESIAEKKSEKREVPNALLTNGWAKSTQRSNKSILKLLSTQTGFKNADSQPQPQPQPHAQSHLQHLAVSEPLCPNADSSSELYNSDNEDPMSSIITPVTVSPPEEKTCPEVNSLRARKVYPVAPEYEGPLPALKPTSHRRENPAVEVSFVRSPASFWLHTNTKEANILHWELQINQLKLIDQGITTCEDLKAGDYCAAQYTDKYWYRARVEEVVKQTGPLTKTVIKKVKVFYFDYGNRALVSFSEVMPLADNMSAFRVQAIHCLLNSVLDGSEGEGNWSPEVCSIFQKELNKNLNHVRAYFYTPLVDNNELQYPVDLFIGKDQKYMAEVLEPFCAMSSSPQPQSQSELQPQLDCQPHPHSTPEDV